MRQGQIVEDDRSYFDKQWYKLEIEGDGPVYSFNEDHLKWVAGQLNVELKED